MTPTPNLRRPSSSSLPAVSPAGSADRRSTGPGPVPGERPEGQALEPKWESAIKLATD